METECIRSSIVDALGVDSLLRLSSVSIHLDESPPQDSNDRYLKSDRTVSSLAKNHEKAISNWISTLACRILDRSAHISAARTLIHATYC